MRSASGFRLSLHSLRLTGKSWPGSGQALNRRAGKRKSQSAQQHFTRTLQRATQPPDGQKPLGFC